LSKNPYSSPTFGAAALIGEPAVLLKNRLQKFQNRAARIVTNLMLSADHL